MKHSEMKGAPSLGGWFIAAAAGLVAAAVAIVIGHFSYSQAGFVGFVIFALVGLILGMNWGTAKRAIPNHATGGDSGDATGAAMAEAVVAEPVKAAKAAASDGPAAMFSSAVPAPAAKPARAAKPKAPATSAKAAAAKTAAKPASVKPAAAKPKKPAGPLRLSAPRKGNADDLKEIEGIGPALEKLCNSLGFYHFDQIANWSAADVDWVDANMKTFKGRIVRDKWIAQSKIIVTEGLDAFRVRAKTNDY